jgi:AcrR family transcriptional regulator
MARPSQVSPRKAKPESGREAIMDVAEQLFAERGIDAVSLRTINAEAGYSVAALHYHFGTRDALIQALLARAQPPMLQRRTKMLEPLAHLKRPELQRIVEALVMPLAVGVFEDPVGGPRTLRFLARLYFDRSPYMAHVLDESLALFMPLLRRAVPNLEERTLIRRWILAAELALASASRLPILDKAPARAERAELEAAFAELVDFIVGGLRA